MSRHRDVRNRAYSYEDEGASEVAYSHMIALHATQPPVHVCV